MKLNIMTKSVNVRRLEGIALYDPLPVHQLDSFADSVQSFTESNVLQ